LRSQAEPGNEFVIRALLGLVVAVSLLFFYRLADRDLWSSHEARAAQDAQSMLLDGDWGLPRLIDGKPDLQKPPLFYWLVALTAHCRGGEVDAWAVRLPAAVSALLSVIGLAGLLAALGRPVAGLVAGVCLGTMCHFTWLARVGRIDMPLTLAVGTAIGSFFLTTRMTSVRPTTRFGLRLLGYLAVAAAIMLKGPIGAVLPAVVLLGQFLVEKWLPRAGGRATKGTQLISAPPAFGDSAGGLSGRNELRPLCGSRWWGVPLVLVLTVPWYWWANQQTSGEFLKVFFWHHNVERGLAGDDGSMHARPWWFYGARLAADLFPWSLLLPVVLIYLLRGGRWRDDATVRLGMVWLVSVVLDQSLFGFKRADYLLPAYPGAALLLGCTIERCYRAVRRPGRLVVGFSAAILACVIGWLVHIGYFLPLDEPHNEQRMFAAAIRRQVPPPQQVMFFRAEDHLLYFHLGRPIHTFLEWENLDVWAGRPGCHYVVMDPHCAAEWPKHISSGRLEEVLRNPGHHKRPLVLMRTIPHPQSGPPTRQ
jgi:4-amino-4-deoxy-L-arabinose transferase-like glycosyltransferase